MLKGVTIILVNKIKTGVDSLNHDVYENQEIYVPDVLIGEPTESEVIETTNLYGKKVAYTLGIPKTDTNVWEDKEVILPAPFTGRYRTIGYSTVGIPEMIPLRWNRKVKVERYG